MPKPCPSNRPRPDLSRMTPKQRIAWVDKQLGLSGDTSFEHWSREQMQAAVAVLRYEIDRRMSTN
jgi:hypothetical protein